MYDVLLIIVSFESGPNALDMYNNVIATRVYREGINTNRQTGKGESEQRRDRGSGARQGDTLSEALFFWTT